MYNMNGHRPDSLKTFRLLPNLWVVYSKSRDPYSCVCYSHSVTLYVRRWAVDLTFGRFGE
jgi:hypothetical protein